MLSTFLSAPPSVSQLEGTDNRNNDGNSIHVQIYHRCLDSTLYSGHSSPSPNRFIVPRRATMTLVGLIKKGLLIKCFVLLLHFAISQSW